MIDGNLVGYSKSVNEFMTLTMKNGILFGTYHLARVYKGEIELRKIDQTEREAPNDAKEKLSSSASSEDDEEA